MATKKKRKASVDVHPKPTAVEQAEERGFVRGLQYGQNLANNIRVVLARMVDANDILIAGMESITSQIDGDDPGLVLKGVTSDTKPRFVNLDSNGDPSPTGDWVYDRQTKLLWARSFLPGEFTYADALEACTRVKFRGQACRAPTLPERQTIVDYARHSPAIDIEYFDSKQTGGWEWTSTPYVSSPRASRGTSSWASAFATGASGRTAFKCGRCSPVSPSPLTFER